MNSRLTILAIVFHLNYLTNGVEKCCPQLGCFSLNPPWTTFTRILPPPRCQDEVPVFFYLYTRRNPRQMYNIQVWPEINLRGSAFDGQKPTIFFFHGWQSKPTSEGSEELKDVYLHAVDANVIMVDYSSSAANRFYPQSASDIRVVAAVASRLANHLIHVMGASPSRIHVIGISLGAQTAAYTARRIPQAARLTGLDPAGPLFEGNDKHVKLNEDDAMFVEVLHTNGLPFGSYGSYSSMGDVDFYFNGGVIQPGCEGGIDENLAENLKTRNFSIIDDLHATVFCSHARSIIYYIYALHNSDCTFWGSRRKTSQYISLNTNQGLINENMRSVRDCTLDSCSPVGLKTIEYPARGSFDVFTTGTSPYCIKHPEVDETMRRELAYYQSQAIQNYTRGKIIGHREIIAFPQP